LGSTVPVTVLGAGFVPGATAVSLTGTGTSTGAFINLSLVNVTSNTSLTGVLTIPTSIPVGIYYVSISTSFGSIVGPVEFTVTSLATGTPFQLVDHASVSISSTGTSQTPVTGYASILLTSGSSAPSGSAIFQFRQGNILVTEAAVPASVTLLSGRVYAEMNDVVNTGLAIANANNQPANLSFYFTDSAGNSGGNGMITVPANGHSAMFLSQAPFNGSSPFTGTFTFSSSVPVSVIALRGLTNERNEFLITTLLVADLSAPASTSAPILPEFADGGGWTTQILLVNPSDDVQSGIVQFLDSFGNPASANVNGQVGSSFPYTLSSRSSQRLRTSGGQISITAGSVRVVPSNGSLAPSGLAIFSFQNGGVTVSESGVPAVPPGTAFRLYAETSGDFIHNAAGSIQTGIAVTNTSPNPASVTLELFKPDGSSTGSSGTLSIPANGQSAIFLDQVQGFAALQTPFHGVLRVSSNATISIVGLRGRYNERTDFLTTTTPSVNEALSAPTVPVYFPHFVDGGGYTTQFILFSGHAGQSSSGTLQIAPGTGP
jgi:hypothetical protein